MIKKICCIGAGYVGGASMAAIALKCPSIEVAVVDDFTFRIANWRGDQLGTCDPDLDAVVKECRGKNLVFSTDIEKHVSEADIVFVSVNSLPETLVYGAGKAVELTRWEEAARMIAAFSKCDKIVVETSTLPARAAEAMEKILSHNSKGIKFQVLSNPEFFGYGTPIKEFVNPDRVLIRGRETPEGQKAVQALKDVYTHWVPEERILTTDLWTAEMAMIAADAFRAQSISSVRAVFALCEATGGSILQVSSAVCTDTGLGPNLLNAGVGFDDSCPRKNILRLTYICECNGLPELANHWRQAIKTADYLKSRFGDRVVSSIPDIVSNTAIMYNYVGPQPGVLQPPTSSQPNPFGNASQVLSTGLNPAGFGAYAENILRSMSSSIETNLKRYFTDSQYYFQVNNHYVQNKLKVVLFPFLHRGQWTRITEPVGGRLSYKPPIYDINAPDLYIPVTAFGTYVILAGISLGLRGKFSPEALNRSFLKGLLGWFMQATLLKATLLSLGSGEAPLLDIIAYAGYTFPGMCLPLLGGMMSRYSHHFLMLYTCFCNGVFLVKTMKRILLAEVKSRDSRKHHYLLLITALAQFPLFTWFSNITANLA